MKESVRTFWSLPHVVAGDFSFRLCNSNTVGAKKLGYAVRFPLSSDVSSHVRFVLALRSRENHVSKAGGITDTEIKSLREEYFEEKRKTFSETTNISVFCGTTIYLRRPLEYRINTMNGPGSRRLCQSGCYTLSVNSRPQSCFW